MDGYLPAVAQVAAAVIVMAAVLCQFRRSGLGRLVAVAAAGGITAFALNCWFESLGLAGEPAPTQLWAWTGVAVAAIVLTAAGWAGAGWLQRNLYALSAAVCLLCVGLTVNAWIGYFPTVPIAFSQLADRRLPGQIEWADVHAMQAGMTAPPRGVLMSIEAGTGASGFAHRDEHVYLPPVWFTTTPPPVLPAVMMIAGQFHTTADWIRAGEAVATLDAYAESHDGYGPVAVFVDSNGAFLNDTECVNGPRGNAADHLTDDVIAYTTARFGVQPAGWGVVGFSAGGTCAVNLTVMNPMQFSTFVDIGGDIGPNTGSKAQTVEQLFGGSVQAWEAFDPITVMHRHRRYDGASGQFVVPESVGGGYQDAATTLCDAARRHGITCTVSTHPGRHTWPAAADAFRQTLPWLMSALRASVKQSS
ncbi:alpha/beta hydrolase [Mycobacterium sp. NPDC048908]|uniref:alpha/beta hydrolase n=1 Tax=Mycobacterium sp. NPDC048908 TaxID=3364292 RepID=UPI003711A770